MIAATKAFRQPVGAWFVLVDEWQNALKPLGLKGFEPAIITGPPKSVSMACWRGLTALALVGGNGSPPCPKSLTQQLISLIPAI